MTSINKPPIIKFSDLFPNETLDIIDELKKFKREDLIKASSLLGIIYQNASFLNSVFFSSVSQKYMDDINHRYIKYKEKHRINNALFCTYKSSLELLRIIYSIPFEDYKGTIKASDIEYELLRVLLRINEQLFHATDLIDDEICDPNLLYYLYYSTYDTVSVDYMSIYSMQLYYCRLLFDFLTTNNTATQYLYEPFLNIFNIKDWREYTGTILLLYLSLYQFQMTNKKGLFYIHERLFSEDCKFLYNKNVIRELSLNLNESIPYESTNKRDKNNNVDYKFFRSKPLICVNDDSHLIYNAQILIEQLYNSIVFRLIDLWDSKNGDFFDYYNKRFIEEYLFHRTMLRSANKSNFYYPSKDAILSEINNANEYKAPDFYIRAKENLYLFECKGIMINGLYKEKDKEIELIAELKKKLYYYINNKGKTVYVGVGQLVNHIENIQYDNQGDLFPWDKKLPQDVCYYPILVLSDMKQVQPGLMSIINNWFYEEMRSRNLHHIAHKPIIVVSIDVLFLYDKLFYKNGFGYYIDRFLYECNAIQDKDGKWSFDIGASFNNYMRSYEHNKNSYFLNTVISMLEHQKQHYMNESGI